MDTEPPTDVPGPLGDGALNQPYEPVAGGPEWVDPTEYITCAGVIVKGGVMILEGSGAVPTLLFDFYTSDGTKMPTAALVCSVDEMLPLTEVVRSAIRDSVREARRR